MKSKKTQSSFTPLKNTHEEVKVAENVTKSKSFLGNSHDEAAIQKTGDAEKQDVQPEVE
jgi:hypothetical protein